MVKKRKGAVCKKRGIVVIYVRTGRPAPYVRIKQGKNYYCTPVLHAEGRGCSLHQITVFAHMNFTSVPFGLV